METPVTSVGSRSGVHWMRLKVQPTLRASARASMVLATPGTSSRRMCPSHRYATRASLIWPRLPKMTFSTLVRTFAAVAATSALPGALLRAGVSVSPLDMAPSGQKRGGRPRRRAGSDSLPRAQDGRATSPVAYCRLSTVATSAGTAGADPAPTRTASATREVGFVTDFDRKSGEGGIRTLGDVAATPVFEAV